MSRDAGTLPGGGSPGTLNPLAGFHSLGGSIEPTGPWANEMDKAMAHARQQGFDQGLAEGRVRGRKQAEDAAEDHMASVNSVVEVVLKALQRREQEVEHRMRFEAAELGLDVATAILDQEVAAATDPGADAIGRCLALAPERGDLFVRLHPGDVEKLGEIDGLLARELTVVPDPSLEPGDAIVMVDQSTIDARRATAIERVRELLT
ncbi:MAG: FliH/SctL family protein [Actinomycetota bacterium]